MKFYSVSRPRDLPAPHWHEETKAQRSTGAPFAIFPGILFCSAAHELITSISISSDLPNCDLESWKACLPLQRKAAKQPSISKVKESQHDFNTWFEKQWNFTAEAHIPVTLLH